MDAKTPSQTPPPIIAKEPPKYQARPIMTLLTCAVCVIVFLGINAEPNPNSWEALSKWGVYPEPRLRGGAYWGFISSAFVHIELWHLAFNLYWLYVLGSRLERAIGSGLWLAIFYWSRNREFRFRICLFRLHWHRRFWRRLRHVRISLDHARTFSDIQGRVNRAHHRFVLSLAGRLLDYDLGQNGERWKRSSRCWPAIWNRLRRMGRLQAAAHVNLDRGLRAHHDLNDSYLVGSMVIPMDFGASYGCMHESVRPHRDPSTEHGIRAG